MRLASIFLAAIILIIGTSLRAQTNVPSHDQFVDVKQEPMEKQPIERLIQYPEVARRSGLEGTVTLQVLVDTDGTVKKVQVLHSDYDVFQDAAISAMKREKFLPAMNNGKPVMVWITRKINFSLGGSDIAENYRKNSILPPLDFTNLIGLSLDSSRAFFELYPKNKSETKQDDGIHLHGESTSPNAKLTRIADGIVSENGLSGLSLLIHASDDSTFVMFAAPWGARGAMRGKLVSETSETEFPHELMIVSANSKDRTVQINIKPR